MIAGRLVVALAVEDQAQRGQGMGLYPPLSKVAEEMPGLLEKGPGLSIVSLLVVDEADCPEHISLLAPISALAEGAQGLPARKRNAEMTSSKISRTP